MSIAVIFMHILDAVVLMHTVVAVIFMYTSDAVFINVSFHLKILGFVYVRYDI